jgi:flagellar export protein FliJ
MSGKFRLRTVERLRAMKLDEVGRALAVANQLLAGAQQRREALAELLTCSRVSDSATPDEVRAGAQHRVVLRERISELDVDIVELHTRADSTRARWVAARADLRAVQMLHEQHRMAQSAERAKEEQRQTDDLAGIRAGATFARRHQNPNADPVHDGPDGGDAA